MARPPGRPPPTPPAFPGGGHGTFGDGPPPFVGVPRNHARPPGRPPRPPPPPPRPPPSFSSRQSWGSENGADPSTASGLSAEESQFNRPWQGSNVGSQAEAVARERVGLENGGSAEGTAESTPRSTVLEDAPAGRTIRSLSPPRAEPGEAYERIIQVGEGTYGQVFKARSERTGVLVALKKIRMEAEKDGFPVTAMREIKLLQALRHENVVRLHEMMIAKGSIYMVFEYMEHDLNGVLNHPSINFSAAHLKSLAHQLLQGLDYLHKKSVLHRDLKGSNILLNNQGLLKLADFGLARFYFKRRKGDYTNRVVTLWYRPPELLFGATQYGPEVDTWGAGCIFAEMFTRKPVFQGQDEVHQIQILNDIMGPILPCRWPGVEKLPWYELTKPDLDPDVAFERHFGQFMEPSALEMARRLLCFDPAKRCSAREALGMPYFTTHPPRPEMPSGLLSGVEGEWHEYESRKARKKANKQRHQQQQHPVPTSKLANEILGVEPS
ncbi:Pkinase-domain-containing protein [Violaceomyces palustris]|uniref:Pkinase-domain-containing protein n=1 Tax=Violaceomyces palustris TaxID=1673888 RepID=A0ACD0NQ12_9BASI|nr:Pkinase-domain-containing protein [Violaceomyces palustris]